jgi:hypothetical protein
MVLTAFVIVPTTALHAANPAMMTASSLSAVSAAGRITAPKYTGNPANTATQASAAMPAGTDVNGLPNSAMITDAAGNVIPANQLPALLNSLQIPGLQLNGNGKNGNKPKGPIVKTLNGLKYAGTEVAWTALWTLLVAKGTLFCCGLLGWPFVLPAVLSGTKAVNRFKQGYNAA